MTDVPPEFPTDEQFQREIAARRAQITNQVARPSDDEENPGDHRKPRY